MDTKEKLQERLEVCHKAIAFERTSRIPYISNDWSWRFLDTELGYSFSEAVGDYEKLEQVVYESIERYPCDGLLCPGTRNNVVLANILGGGRHKVANEGAVVQTLDSSPFDPEDYAAYAKNPILTSWEKFFPKRFGRLNLQQIEDSVKAVMDFGALGARMNKTMEEKYGIPPLGPMTGLPIEPMFTNFRGIKGVSMDMRRNTQLVEDFVTATKPGFLAKAEQTMKAYKGKSICGTVITFLAHSVMGNKQFERFYWSVYKDYIDLAVKYNAPIYQFTEATLLRFADFFDDVPKGTIVAHLEQDDIFETRKRLPNIALAGGMPTTMLYQGTIEQCVDYAKKLIDELGAEGGYLFSQNKMMTYANDAKRENLMAVVDFVNSYRI